MLTQSSAPNLGLTDAMAGVAEDDSPIFTLPSPNIAPLVDLAVLHELEQQVGDRATVLGFVHDFVDLWTSRYHRLVDGLELFDADATLDVLISIKASAAMAGAVRLSRDAEELERVVRCGDEAASSGLLPKLKACGEQTLRELGDRYLKPLDAR